MNKVIAGMAAVTIAFLSGVSAVFVFGQTGDSHAIVPGKRVGSVVVNEQLPKSLGEPTAKDGTPERSLNFYISKTAPHYRLQVLARRVVNGRPSVVRTIRVDSPLFRTADGITPHSPVVEIRKRYPQLGTDEHWVHTVGRSIRQSAILDDRKQGIAFEIGKGESRATAIYIHAPGEPLEIYGTD